MIQTLVVGSYSENEHESFISEKNNGQYLLPVIKLEPGVKEPWVVVSTVRHDSFPSPKDLSDEINSDSRKLYSLICMFKCINI